MKPFLFALIIFLAPNLVAAGPGGLLLFGGGSLSRATTKISNSQFNMGGWAAEGGILFPLMTSLDVKLTGELSYADGNNTRDDANLMERALRQSTGFKLGFASGMLEVGGGVRTNKFRIRTLTTADGTTESTYDTNTSLGFLRFNFESKNFMTSVEGQYHTGSLGTYSLSEIAAVITFSFIFGR